MERQTVYTVTANCHDCYRCVRSCPVKAISLRNGQAQVEDALCIKCGSCVRECPQGAKTIRSDLTDVKTAGETFSLVASIAPSFAAVYSGNLANRLPSALRTIGFSHAAETAEGERNNCQKHTQKCA
jgi:Fe-S-cluster-containing hydrogenase component 2